MEDKKYCPLQVITHHQHQSARPLCNEEKCGWWSDYNKCCAISVLPIAIEEGINDLVRMINAK